MNNQGTFNINKRLIIVTLPSNSKAGEKFAAQHPKEAASFFCLYNKKYYYYNRSAIAIQLFIPQFF